MSIGRINGCVRLDRRKLWARVGCFMMGLEKRRQAKCLQGALINTIGRSTVS